MFVIPFLNAGLAFVLSSYYLNQFRLHRKWEAWEISAFLLPQLAWATCMAYSSVGKSLANLGEATPVILVTPIFVGLRAVLGDRRCPRLISAVFILVLVAIGLSCLLFHPCSSRRQHRASKRALRHLCCFSSFPGRYCLLSF